jgi:geranylgeranyl pyrophosphate synthase
MQLTVPVRAGAQPNGDPVDRIRRELLADDLDRFYQVLFETLEPQRPYLTETEYELYRQGKKLRPVMLLLSARMMHGMTSALPPKAIQGAVSLEMLHVATLIHDDIVDGALVRRGMPSVNAARGTATSVVVGDLQFVQAIRGFVEAIDVQEDMVLVKLVLDTAFKICCGELDELQTDPSWATRVLHERYLQTIDRKTAVLFGLACEAGVALVSSHSSDARRAGFYGRRVGKAFQMMDDLLDFLHGAEDAGKSLGMDLSARRPSLPLIYAMEELGAAHRVTRIMRGAPFAPDELRGCVEAVKATQGFARAYAEARAAGLEALEYLRPFPHNRYRAALEEIALHVVDRT